MPRAAGSGPDPELELTEESAGPWRVWEPPSEVQAAEPVAPKQPPPLFVDGKRQPQIGDRVFWEGDVCNQPRDGKVVEIKDSRFGRQVRVTWNFPEGEPFRDAWVYPAQFTSPRWGWVDDREAKYAAYLAELHAKYGKPDAAPEPTPEPPSVIAISKPPTPVAPSQPSPSPFHQILAVPLPSVRRLGLRRETRKVWAAEVRRLFRDLSIKNLSVTAPNYSMASSISIRLPEEAEHDRSPESGHSYPECPICQERNRACGRIREIIVAAFPDMDDRSDYQSDYFDNPLSIN